MKVCGCFCLLEETICHVNTFYTHFCHKRPFFQICVKELMLITISKIPFFFSFSRVFDEGLNIILILVKMYFLFCDGLPRESLAFLGLQGLFILSNCTKTENFSRQTFITPRAFLLSPIEIHNW